MMLCMEKILVSACLLGEKCTYEGKDNAQPYLKDLNRYYDIVPFCPEVEGGLPTPRKPSEIKGPSVVRQDGVDVTSCFREGAYKATTIASFLGIRLAIMKENSPSCGPHFVYDGYFRGRKIPGEGVTVAALRRQGVTVLNEEEGLALLERLQKQEQIKDEKTRVAKAKEAKESKPQGEEPKPREDKPRGKAYPKSKKPFGKGGKAYHPNGHPPGKSYRAKTHPFTDRKPYIRKPKGE